MLEDGFFDPRKPYTIRWGELPHWRQQGATYFVTFRLCDSLPKQRLDRWRHERDAWREAHPKPTTAELEEFARRHRGKIEKWLDEGSGSCLLSDQTARSIVERTIRFFEGERYELGELTIAQNHVHVVARTALDVDVSDVLHSWKRQSSREIRANPELRSRGPRDPRHLWQLESFDHIVRNSESLDRIAAYIRSHNLPRIP